ncbi:MAG: hypothetical protein JO006_09665 [Paucibacter sp.]|nr:hypothetical protein [Roseateles sp.]
MFGRRLAELKARELELRLRSLELREELQICRQALAEPLAWAGLAGTGMGLAVLLLRLRHAGRSRRPLAWLRLGLRLARLWRRLSGSRRDPGTASSGPPSGLASGPASSP